MSTIRDVARLAGVSTATVSATLSGNAFVSEPLRARVHEAVEALGYSPHGIARSLKRGSTRMIGLVIPDVTNPFFTELVHVVEGLAHADGFAVLLCDTGFDVQREKYTIALLRTQRVDGIILCAAGGDADYEGAFAIGTAPPVVMVDNAPPAPGVDCVVVDNYAAAHTATMHLIDLGHRRVASVAGPPIGLPGRERVRGFEAALRERGIPVDPARVVSGSFREEGGRRAIASLLALDPSPTAVFVANNQMLIGVMRGLHEAGLSVPGEMSVAAIDDFPWATAFRPALTTVRQPVSEIARHAVALVEKRIAGDRSDPVRVELAAELMTRESVARPEPSRADTR